MTGGLPLERMPRMNHLSGSEGLPQDRPQWVRRNGNEAGATMAEYALLLGLIVLVAVGAVAFFGEAVLGLFQSAVNALPF